MTLPGCDWRFAPEPLDEFRAQPFIHRAEHSLHVRLVQLLGEWEHLQGWHPIGDSGFKTQLIHKVWPETMPRKKKAEPLADRRRGSFDLVVPAPSQLRAATLAQFTGGRIRCALPRARLP